MTEEQPTFLKKLADYVVQNELIERGAKLVACQDREDPNEDGRHFVRFEFREHSDGERELILYYE